MRLFDLIVQSAGELSTGSLLLRCALVATSIFAVVHLISLWGTRYGDRYTLAQSLFLSLLLHGCLGLGWATVSEAYPKRMIGTEPNTTVQTPINLVESTDSAPVIGKNKLPIFRSGPTESGVSIAKDVRTTTRINGELAEDPIDTPERNKTPEMSVAEEIPVFQAPVEEKLPDLEPTVDSQVKAEVTTPMTIDQPELEARPETSTKTSTARTSGMRPSNTIESATRSQIQKGAASRMTSTIEDGEVITFPSEVTLEALPRPQGHPNEQVLRRQGSAEPSEIIDSTAGTGPENIASSTNQEAPRRTERRTRSTSAPGEGMNDGPQRPSVASTSASPRRPTTGTRTTDDRLTSSAPIEPTDETAQPTIERPRAPAIARTPARAPETYQARSLGQRKSNVLKNGGSEESEAAVENSLKWMASVQEPDGRWSASKHGGGAVDKDPQGQPRLDGGKFADSGITGLVLLSFLGAGYTHEKGPYTEEVKQGLDWLIGQQQSKNGYLGGDATRFDQNYCHAIATFALAEAYAMQKDANEYPQLRNAVRRGVDLIAALQNEDGGWRYGKGTDTDSDMSMFGWQLMALKSAVNGGISVPEKTRRGMVKFLDERARGNQGGLAGYRRKDQPTPAMTAEALFCRQMFTTHNDDAASREAVAYLLRNLPRATSYDEYYWYYGTLAMHQVDDASWHEWNQSVRDLLIMTQRREGPLAGSWNPNGKWAGIGGRLYSTALSTMCLEVYYRYQLKSK